MARTIRLRRWQKEALERFAERPGPDFLAVATPGAGKTTFALAAARHALARAPRRLIVVAPTQHLKNQWAANALGFDLHLEADWSAADGALPADLHGIVTTYQQVASSALALRVLARDAVVILDEVHHAGDELAWGDGVRSAFEPASERLMLSGTPFRSDTQSIPFVRYEDDEARADYEYGYGDALADRGVVRPVYFPRVDGEMEWVAPDGSLVSARFADPLDAVRSAQRLRTALSLEGDWVSEVLGQAHRQLVEVRATHADAGGLVIAVDQEHARGISELMRRTLGIRPVVVLSEDPRASERISRFARSSEPWIIAVRMVSEGVDIPRLRVGVFATTTTTELFFRQAVGRLVRWSRGLGAQRAYMFIPDDPRLRGHAFGIAEQRRHLLRRREDEDPFDRVEDWDPTAEPDREEQLSLFAAMSAVVVGAPAVHAVAAAVGSDEHDPAEDGDGAEGHEAQLPPLLLPSGLAPAAAAAAESPRARRLRLRDANAERVQHIVRVAGLSHAQVNGELNRRSGIRRITEATAVELERRLEHADRWLRRL